MHTNIGFIAVRYANATLFHFMPWFTTKLHRNHVTQRLLAAANTQYSTAVLKPFTFNSKNLFNLEGA